MICVFLKNMKHATSFLYLPGSKVTKIEATVVPCTQISMSFFDQLYSEGIVRETGAIAKCYDDYYDDILIADELRKVSIIMNNLLSFFYSVRYYKDRGFFSVGFFFFLTVVKTDINSHGLQTTEALQCLNM